MDRVFKSTQLAISVLLALLVGSVAHAQPPNFLQAHKAQKPLVLEVRHCLCAVIDSVASDDGPTAHFLSESSAMRVGISENEGGFVSSGPMTFGYSFSPAKQGAESFMLAFSGEYSAGVRKVAFQGRSVVNLGTWVILAGSLGTHEDITPAGSKGTGEKRENNFGVAIKLSANAGQ